MIKSKEIKAIIIDDEKSAREVLINILARFFSHVKIIAQASSIEEGIAVLNNNKTDIVFLDIEMPFGNSFDILENVNNSDFDVIFVTAHEKYALESFKFPVIDYLLKPIKIKDINKALQKFEKHRIPKNEIKESLKVFIDSNNNNVKKIVIPTINGFDIIDISTIIRLKGERNYTNFYLSDGRKLLVSKTLKNFEEILSKYNFFRLHQSHIVNIQHIKRFFKRQNGEVEMSDGKLIPISRTKKEEFLNFFQVND